MQFYVYIISRPHTVNAPHDLTLSSHPIDNLIDMHIYIEGIHPILGLNLQVYKEINRMRLLQYMSGTPAVRIPH